MKRNMINQTSRQQGATLLEITMVIGVVALIAVAAVLAYNGMTESRRIQSATGNLGNIVSCVRNVFGAQGNYAGANNEVIISAKCLGEEWYSGSNVIHHPWDDDAVDVAAAGGSAARTFTVAYEGLPEDVCVKIASTTISNAVSMRVGSGLVNNVGQIVTRCSDDATIIWTFN